MGVEIEAKVKMEDLPGAAKRLAALGAEHADDFAHVDIYYGGGGGMIKRGCGLRLRRERGRSGEKVWLTYKGPKEKGRFKTRKELEVEVGDGSAMDELLEEIGLRRELVIEKRRSLWVYKGCKVCLDELPLLGGFVEVEGEGEAVIAKVLEDLGFEALEHINEGYACLVRRRLEESGAAGRRAVFER